LVNKKEVYYAFLTTFSISYSSTGNKDYHIPAKERGLFFVL